MRERGYLQGDQPFRWSRTVLVGEREIAVEIDLLAPVTPRTPCAHRHERVGGEPLARRTEGAEPVREAAVERALVGLLPDGRHHQARVRVAAPAAFIVLKALAMGSRDKPKDAYDIDYVLRHLDVDEVAADIRAFGDVRSVRTARAILADRFASVGGLGSQGVALYRRLPLGSAEADQAQAQAFARVRTAAGPHRHLITRRPRGRHRAIHPS